MTTHRANNVILAQAWLWWCTDTPAAARPIRW
jgi:hypothetical protein